MEKNMSENQEQKRVENEGQNDTQRVPACLLRQRRYNVCQFLYGACQDGVRLQNVF